MSKLNKLMGLVMAAGMLLSTSFVWGTHTAHASGGTDHLQLLPLYVHPDLSSSPSVWKTICGSMNDAGSGSTVIANLGAGYGSVPGGPEGFGYPATADPGYTSAIRYCRNNGVNVVGYVTTNYGARPISDVKQDVSDWYRLYPKLDGIFLDQANNSTDPTNQTYYHDIWSYIQSTAPTTNQNDVIANPGNTDKNSAWMLGDPSSSTQATDELVVFSGSETCFHQWETNNLSGACQTTYGTAGEPSWERKWGYPDDIAVLLYGAATDGSSVAATCSDLASAGSYLNGVTDEADDLWVSAPGSTEWNAFLAHCS